MSDETFDRDFWEERWGRALREHGEALAALPPHPALVEVAAPLTPGLALDAGCGRGAESMWLAAAGWTVTAVDFSVTALEQGRVTSRSAGPDIAGRIDWVEGDLSRWVPSHGLFDLVACLYVHVAGSVPDLVRRLGSGVAPGGTLFLVGHLPVDPATGEPTAAAGQNQVSVPAALEALPDDEWDVLVAEERPRRAAGTGSDAVVHAVRR